MAGICTRAETSPPELFSLVVPLEDTALAVDKA